MGNICVPGRRAGYIKKENIEFFSGGTIQFSMNSSIGCDTKSNIQLCHTKSCTWREPGSQQVIDGAFFLVHF